MEEVGIIFFNFLLIVSGFSIENVVDSIYINIVIVILLDGLIMIVYDVVLWFGLVCVVDVGVFDVLFWVDFDFSVAGVLGVVYMGEGFFEDVIVELVCFWDIMVEGFEGVGWVNFEFY